MLEEIIKLIEEYERWINKNIRLSSGWVDEVEYLSFIRGKIHQLSKDLDLNDVPEQISKLVELDRVWQSQALTNREADFHLEHPRNNIPRYFWWEWIDQLDTLSEAERETI